MIDHYSELIFAGVQRWGKSFADEIEVQAINAAILDKSFVITGLPTNNYFDKRVWKAVRRLSNTELGLETDDSCDVCSGDGQLHVYGKDRSDHYVECPGCHGYAVHPQAFFIVTDMQGVYLREWVQ